MIEVDHYGLHFDRQIAWLLQGRKGSNFVGLKAQCPFTVSGGMCNHLVPAAAPIPDPIHWEQFAKLLPDPLVKVMLPIPAKGQEKAYYLTDEDDGLLSYLITLSRMSSPIRTVVKPAWMVKAKDLEKLMWESNIQPLILNQIEEKNQDIVDLVGRVSVIAPRKVILVGKPGLVIRPPLQRLETGIQKFDKHDLMALPFEALGATVLRRFSRREPIDAPIERREDRRARQINERMNKR